VRGVSPRHAECLATYPSPGGRLSDGLVVDASIQARLLGLRLLTLNAQITLVPANFAMVRAPQSGTVAQPAEPGEAVGSLADAVRTLDRIGHRLGNGWPSSRESGNGDRLPP
jgi:hypothetical protein